MVEGIVPYIGTVVSAIVPSIIYRSMYPNVRFDFRWIALAGVIFLAGAAFQYRILTTYNQPEALTSTTIKPNNTDETLFVPTSSAQFHYPAWKYHYNSGDSYVEGFSEVRLAGTSVAFQYRANIQCSDPNTLRFSIGERKEREFVTETSSLGNVTEVSIFIDRRVMLDIRKLPVTDNKAILYISDLADVYLRVYC